MVRVHYIHWHPEEALARATRLQSLGLLVETEPFDAPGARVRLRAAAPDVIVIDLSRLPSHGREVATWITGTKSMQHVPFVFLEGDAEKTAQTRRQFADAVFATWENVRQQIPQAIALWKQGNAPVRPIAGSSMVCSTTPLAAKLGITKPCVVTILDAPADFLTALGSLPEGVAVKTTLRARCDLMIWFPRNLADFEHRLASVVRSVPSGGVWVAWRKQSSGVSNDLGQNHIRNVLLTCGLVDYKICSINPVWSGMKFART